MNETILNVPAIKWKLTPSNLKHTLKSRIMPPIKWNISPKSINDTQKWKFKTLERFLLVFSIYLGVKILGIPVPNLGGIISTNWGQKNRGQFPFFEGIINSDPK